MIKLTDEPNGKFFISNYGLYHALFFEGDDKFLEKAQNFCVNTGVLIRGEFFSPHPNQMYCLAPQERIIKGFAAQFRAEIILTEKSLVDYVEKEIVDSEGDNVGVEISYDEKLADEISWERAQEYYNSLEKNNLLANIKKQDYSEFFGICS